MTVFMCMEDPWLSWVTALNSSWYQGGDVEGRKGGGKGGRMSVFLVVSLFLSSPSRWTLTSLCVCHPYNALQRESSRPCSKQVSTQQWQRSGEQLWAGGLGWVIGVKGSRVGHTSHQICSLPGKQPAERKSCLSNSRETVTSDSWPWSQPALSHHTHPHHHNDWHVYIQTHQPVPVLLFFTVA